MLNLKCKRYIESKGAKCGHSSAERRFVTKQRGREDFDISGESKSGQRQCVGTFCFPCWLEVIETLPLRMFFSFTPLPGSELEERARKAVRAKVDGLRKVWQEEVQKHEARLKNAG